MPVPDSKMASMTAAIVNGVTLARAVEKGLVTTDEERDVWKALVQDVEDIHKRGFIVGGIDGNWDWTAP